MKPIPTILIIISVATVHAETNAHTSIADSMPSSWKTNSDLYQTSPVEDEWWKEFNDPVLS